MANEQKQGTESVNSIIKQTQKGRKQQAAEAGDVTAAEAKAASKEEKHHDAELQQRGGTSLEISVERSRRQPCALWRRAALVYTLVHPCCLCDLGKTALPRSCVF